MAVAILLSIFVSCVFASEEVKDGGLYQLTNGLDNNVLTVTSTEMETGSNMTLQPWRDEAGQKWLAVSFKQGGDRETFLLVPRRQKFDWAKFVAQGSGSLKDRRGDLPDAALVLAVEVTDGVKFVTQQFKNEKPSQQWQFNKIGNSGKYLVKNVESELCLENQRIEKKHGILNKVKSGVTGIFKKDKKPKFPLVHMDGCNKDEVGQQWTLESHI